MLCLVQSVKGKKKEGGKLSAEGQEMELIALPIGRGTGFRLSTSFLQFPKVKEKRKQEGYGLRLNLEWSLTVSLSLLLFVFEGINRKRFEVSSWVQSFLPVPAHSSCLLTGSRVKEWKKVIEGQEMKLWNRRRRWRKWNCSTERFSSVWSSRQIQYILTDSLTVPSGILNSLAALQTINSISGRRKNPSIE